MRSLARRGLNVPKHAARSFFRFLSKGNVIEYSIAVVMGQAFNDIVNSIVKNVLSPIIGLAGTNNLENYYVAMKGYNGTTYPTSAEANNNRIVTLNLGAVASSIISFFLVALLSYAIAKTLLDYMNSHFKDDEKDNCLYCYELINVKATICAFCLSPYPFVPTSEPEAIQENQQETLTVPPTINK